MCKENRGVIVERDSQEPFSFVRRSILSVEHFEKESLWVQRLHSLVVQTIFYFKMKVKELRSIADEEIRAVEDAVERGHPPIQVSMNFMQFMLMISDLYEMDACGLNLRDQFWCHPEVASDDSLIRARYSPLQTALFKFLRSSGELLPAVLYVAYLKMLRSLANSLQCSTQAFELLRTNGSYGGSQLSSVPLSHFFSALQNYCAALKSHLHGGKVGGIQISPDETQGLVAWCELIAKVADNDESVRLLLAETAPWQCLKSCFGLLVCGVSLKLKGFNLWSRVRLIFANLET